MRVRASWSWGLVTLVGLGAPAILRGAETVNDGYSTPSTTPLAISAPGILANDDCEGCAVVSVNGLFFEGQISFGPATGDGDPLPTLPSGARLTVHFDGGFTYDPSTLTDPAQPSDSFTYQAEDSRGLSGQATVTITLTEPPASSAPVATDDQYSVELGSVLTVPAPGILGNDTDADGDPLAVALVNGTEPSFGSPVPLTYGDLVIQEDGSFTYTPNAEAAAGVDEGFSYTASDGANLSSSAFVGIGLTESTTGDTVANVRFDDVWLVVLDAEIGRSGIDQLELGARSGSLAQVAGPGLPPQAGALVLRSSGAQNAADAREVLQGCERMALVAQSQPVKYDLVVEVSSATPETSFTQGVDGELIVEISETRVKCWTDRGAV